MGEMYPLPPSQPKPSNTEREYPNEFIKKNQNISAENVSLSSGNFTATNTKDALDELFQNVSDGKTLLSTAITDKGGTVEGETFAALDAGIRSIPAGGGTAVVGDVLAGKTFSADGGTGLIGTMVNRGAVTITPGTTIQIIEEGYHNGNGLVLPGGARIQSLQRGTVNNSGSLTTFTTTITSVDLSKSIVIASARGSNLEFGFTASFSNATTLSFKVSTGATNQFIEWTVITFDNAVVQYGVMNMRSVSSKTATISSVDISKSFIIGTCINTTVWPNTSWTITNATTITGNRAVTNGASVIYWFVVTF